MLYIYSDPNKEPTAYSRFFIKAEKCKICSNRAGYNVVSNSGHDKKINGEEKDDFISKYWKRRPSRWKGAEQPTAIWAWPGERQLQFGWVVRTAGCNFESPERTPNANLPTTNYYRGGEELINYIICRLVEAAVLFQLRDGALSSIGQQDGEGFGGAVLGSKATLCLPSALPTPF